MGRDPHRRRHNRTDRLCVSATDLGLRQRARINPSEARRERQEVGADGRVKSLGIIPSEPRKTATHLPSTAPVLFRHYQFHQMIHQWCQCQRRVTRCPGHLRFLYGGPDPCFWPSFYSCSARPAAGAAAAGASVVAFRSTFSTPLLCVGRAQSSRCIAVSAWRSFFNNWSRSGLGRMTSACLRISFAHSTTRS